MFQFPGFALMFLCIQIISTCFTPLLRTLPTQAPNRPRAGAERTLQSNNNRVSGGLPHSEIHGSKLILSSPWLIAEYHVLHRLLLPRHSPNALFALDLIQKTQDWPKRPTASGYLRTFACPRRRKYRAKAKAHASRSEVTFPAPAAGSQPGHFWLVYLTWNKIAVRGEPGGHPLRG
jgi:hypothetical protein